MAPALIYRDGSWWGFEVAGIRGLGYASPHAARIAAGAVATAAGQCLRGHARVPGRERCAPCALDDSRARRRLRAAA